jgi:hypothetical protein
MGQSQILTINHSKSSMVWESDGNSFWNGQNADSRHSDPIPGPSIGATDRYQSISGVRRVKLSTETSILEDIDRCQFIGHFNDPAVISQKR